MGVGWGDCRARVLTGYGLLLLLTQHGYSFEEVVTPGRMFDSIRKVVEDNMRADRSAIKTPVSAVVKWCYLPVVSSR